jgi:hypothetical protein
MILTVLLTLVGFVVSIPIGGWLARRQVISDWTLDDEIEWWINLVRKG